MIVSSSWKTHGLMASGEGMLFKSDLDFWKNDPILMDPGGFSFELEEGITHVEPGLFLLCPGLRTLELGRSVKDIGVDEETISLFKKNDVLIRGFFDTYAEKFAREHGLRFLHSDFELGRGGDYFEHGSYVITLKLTDSGKPWIRESEFSQGSSAGSSGGGDETVSLPEDFYLTCSADDIAYLCWGACASAIRKNEKLKTFLNKARKKKGFRF